MDKTKRFLMTALIISIVAPLMGLVNPVFAQTRMLEQSTSVELIKVPADVTDLQSAILAISDGGIIELAAGTYVSPAGGWRANNLHKGLTIRAADGATVILDGQGSRDLFRLQNTSVAEGGPITFENLVFANGYTNVEGTAAGLTIYYAEATFINCEFRNNVANVSTLGGAVFIAANSRVFFFNSKWENNVSRAGGGAIGIRSESTVYIHQAQFINNHTNNAYHDKYASGGAVNSANSDLYISNSRFERNEAGAYGGALYALGSWNEQVATPTANVIVVNSTFVDNKGLRHPSVNESFPTEGGAINVEDQALLTIYHSHFEKNEADIAGGVNDYRATVEIHNSVFLGNRAVGTVFNGSFGGSISLNSADVPQDGNHNRPTASLLVEDTYIQGAYENIQTVAHSGGCVQVGGDLSRLDGNANVPDMGSIADNRANAILRRVVLNDCDVAVIDKYSGIGGGILTSIANITVEDSLIVNSEALGGMASGGGMAILFGSVANIDSSTIGYNTSGMFGGGIFVQGSTLNVSNSNFLHNEVSPGVTEDYWLSYGAAIFTSPDDVRKLSAGGKIQNNTFSNNIGLVLFDVDRTNGPINDVQYNNNEFYESAYGNYIIYGDLIPKADVSALNATVVYRANGTSTNKSANDNMALTAQPVIVDYNMAPQTILSAGQGDPAGVISAHLALIWQASGANLDTVSLSDPVYVTTFDDATSKTLRVAGIDYNIMLDVAEEPAAVLELVTSDGELALEWHVQSGSLLMAAIDNGTKVKTTACNGEVTVSAVGSVYRFYAITKEGGVVVAQSTNQPVLDVEASSTLIVEQSGLPITQEIAVRNSGGAVMTWTATASEADTISIIAPQNEQTGDGVVVFKVDPTGKQCGQYVENILIDANSAGSETIQVTVIVVAKVYSVNMPTVIR